LLTVLNGDVSAYTQRFWSVEHVHTTALRGFSVRLSEKQAASLAHESGVDAVVPDTPVSAAASTPDRLCNVPPGTGNRLLYVG
jgi:hypothetical protein